MRNIKTVIEKIKQVTPKSFGDYERFIERLGDVVYTSDRCPPELQFKAWEVLHNLIDEYVYHVDGLKYMDDWRMKAFCIYLAKTEEEVSKLWKYET